jgi:hypothetical protein
MEVRKRLSEWGTILKTPWKWVVLAFALLGAYQEIQQQFAPNWPSTLPGSPSVWFFLALVLFCVLLLEGAYRRIRAIRKAAKEREELLTSERNTLANQLEAVKAQPSKLQNIPAAINNRGGTIKVAGSTKVDAKGNADGVRVTDGGTFETGQLKVNKEES